MSSIGNCEAILQGSVGVHTCGKTCGANARFCAKHSRPVTDGVYSKICATLSEFKLCLTHGKVGYVNTKTPCDVTCDHGHVTRGAVEIVCNKHRKNLSRVGCSKCRAEFNEADSALNRIKKKLNSLGHVLVSNESANNGHYTIVYVCKCSLDRGERVETRTDSSNILKEVWGGCGACLNERSGAKHKFETVAREFAERGFELLDNTYVDNHTKMRFKCTCGEEGAISLKEVKNGYHCGKCRSQLYRETMQKEHGVDNIFQLEDTKQKARKTNMEKLGVEYPMQDAATLERRDMTVKNTYDINYTFHTSSSSARGSESIESMYGAHTYPVSKTGQVQNVARFGAANPMQNAAIHSKQQKTANKFKTYQMPGGRMIHVQGYETFAIDYLLKYAKEDDILVDRTNMPVLYYKYEGRAHRYFPDIYVRSPDLTMVVEVKSMYTLHNDIHKNRCKFRYTDSCDIMIIILVFGEKGGEPVLEIVEDSQFDELCARDPEELDREILEQNMMMYDEYISFVQELKDRNVSKMPAQNDTDEQSDKTESEEEKEVKEMAAPEKKEIKSYLGITNLGLQVVYDQVKAGKRDADDLKAFDAKTLKAFAEKLGAQFGVKKNQDKKILIKKILNPEYYAKGSAIRYAYHDKMDLIEAQGHTDISWKRPKINYRCKNCCEMRTTEPKLINKEWRMCNICSNRAHNSERAKMKTGMKYKEDTQE